MPHQENETAVEVRRELRDRFTEELRAKVLMVTGLKHHSWRKRKGNRCEASKLGIWMNFIAYEGNCRVQVYLGRKPEVESRAIYQELLAKQNEIEANCCRKLRWKGDDPRHFPTIEMPVKPDEVLDELKWSKIQSAMIAAMIRFDAALAPYLNVHRAGGAVNLSRKTDARRESR